MSGGWNKYLSNGDKEGGSDKETINKTASWSQGRQDIFQADVYHDNRTIIIDGPGSYWQSDDYEICIGDKWPTMTTRRLQRQLQQGDICIDIFNTTDFQLIAAVGGLKNFTKNSANCKRIMLSTNDIGKWLTVELDLATKTHRYYLAENKI